jgi:hypothetical protein
MLPRALMVPPGIPDFLSRARTLPRAACAIEGRAWSGFGPVAEVEFSFDGGASWARAELDPPPGPHAWQAWRHTWTPAAAGACELCCRARDVAGNTQPLTARWNFGGYANNEVQRVLVTVV